MHWYDFGVGHGGDKSDVVVMPVVENFSMSLKEAMVEQEPNSGPRCHFLLTCVKMDQTKMFTEMSVTSFS